MFQALGEARDRHVRASVLAPRLARAGAPVLEAAGSSRDDAAMLQRLVREPAFLHLIDALAAFAQGSSTAPGATTGGGLEHLAACLDRLERQVTRGARQFESLPFDRQHQVRKRLKRLRYLAEFAAPAFERAEVKAWKACVARAQEALGKYVDLVAAARHFEQLAASDPRAWFAVGWLEARAKRSARAARNALLAMRGAEAFWAVR